MEDERSAPARRRYAVECAVTAVVALLWLAWLVSGRGGPRVTQAVSNFGLIAAAAAAGVTCLLTARRTATRHRWLWRLLGASALSWGSGQAAWTWYETVLGRDVPSPRWPTSATWRRCRSRPPR
jgi:hypothetical protein